MTETNSTWGYLDTALLVEELRTPAMKMPEPEFDSVVCSPKVLAVIKAALPVPPPGVMKMPADTLMGIPLFVGETAEECAYIAMDLRIKGKRPVWIKDPTT